MKVSNFLGTGVLDKNAFEVGKVVDMFIEPEKGIINSIIVSTGEFGLKKKDSHGKNRGNRKCRGLHSPKH